MGVELRRGPRGPCAEGVGFRLNEGPPRRPPPAATITWLGEGVVQVPGVGVFARHVTASVTPEQAERLRGQPGWHVELPPTCPPPGNEASSQET